MADASEKHGQTLELLTTILLAIATILTAWSAFQSTKWSGTQADAYSRASAARTESAKASTRAGQQTIIDVQTFLNWTTALAQERIASPGASTGPDGKYLPAPGSLSGFIYARMRDEFKPAVDAWIATNPLTNPSAPKTPFTLPEYRLAATKQANQLTKEADASAARARSANQRGDNYVLLTVLFASVLFFASLSTKLKAPRNQWLMFSFALILIGAGIVMLLSFPVEV